MTTALAQIQEEIAKLEERLKLLRTAEAALQALEAKVEKSVYENNPYLFNNKPTKGLAAAIRTLLTDKGSMTKADIDKALSEAEWFLGKGSVSGALQAMKVRGVVARTKAGKWTVK
jgi:hypothetical protein